MRCIIDWHWTMYTDSCDPPPPEMQGVFRRAPDFTVLGEFDAAHLDADKRAVVDGWHSAAVQRFWEQASDDYKMLFDPSRHEVDDDVAGEHELNGQGESMLHHAEEPEPVRPPRLTMQQMEYLLHSES